MTNSVVLWADIKLSKLWCWGFEVWSLGSSDIHSPSKIVMIWSKWYVSKLNTLKVYYSNKSWGLRVKAMEICYSVWCKHLWSIFPGDLLQPKSFPLNQVLILLLIPATIQNLFHFPLFLSIDNDRVQRQFWISS